MGLDQARLIVFTSSILSLRSTLGAVLSHIRERANEAVVDGPAHPLGHSALCQAAGSFHR
jgi:hypothetical protein